MNLELNITNKLMETSLRKECKEPWFSLIKVGKKKYEGRVRKGYWSQVKIGDKITLYNNDNEYVVEVRELLYFDDFKAAYRSLGEQLLPYVDSEEECWRIYNNFNDDEIISKNGVVAIGIIKLE